MHVQNPSGGAMTFESASVHLAQAGWLKVLDDIHGGLCHDLNGRVASLDGLIQILQMDGPEDTPVNSYLQNEAERLGEVVQTLRSLGGDVDGPPEPLLAADVAAHALRLHRRHRGLEVVTTESSVEEGLPPFRANPARLARVLLVLLSRAGRAAAESGVRAVRLGAHAEGGDVVLEVRCDVADSPWERSCLEALELALAGESGRVERVGPAGVVRLPAMGPLGA